MIFIGGTDLEKPAQTEDQRPTLKYRINLLKLTQNPLTM